MTKPVVIETIIDGGLGNQMFQYAAGRRLALATGGALVLMKLQNQQNSAHTVYGLRTFNITGREVAADIPAPRFDRSLWRRIAPWLPEYLRGRESRTLICEPNVWNFIAASKAGELRETGSLLFVPEILTRRRDTKLFGYWQNEVYFRDVAEVIRSDFTLREEMDERNLAVQALIKSRTSAFLHVRRGDYLDPVFGGRFGTCAAAYYHQAVGLLREKHGRDLAIFVFGNDPEWIRENQIGGADAVFVDWNDAAPARDLMLMRACQHAVIANSSFSWWGAWLGEWPGQTVIAPKIWFNAVPEFRDIVPERWIRL